MEHPRRVRDGTRVEYVGDEDGEHHFFRGHPAVVIDTYSWPREVSVSFVNGPSVCLRGDAVAPVSDQEYLRRGRRLVDGLHPLVDREVPRFNAAGHEWPEGREPEPPESGN